MKKRKWKKSDTIGWLVMLPTLVLFTFFRLGTVIGEYTDFSLQCKGI